MSKQLRHELYEELCLPIGPSSPFTKDQCDQKKSPNVYKSCPKNDFTRKVIDLETFTKIALECGRFGQINCCQRL